MQNKNFLPDLIVSPRLKDILSAIVLWGRIIAIINFVTIPLEFYNDIRTNDVFMGIITATGVLIINIFLLQFSIKVKKGIVDTDQRDFNSGMKNLRDYFKIVGIFIILLMLAGVITMVYAISVSNSSSYPF